MTGPANPGDSPYPYGGQPQQPGVPGSPEGGAPGYPNAQPGYPNAQPGFPGAQPGYPAGQPGAGQPGFPGAQPGFPPGQPGQPGMPGYPVAPPKKSKTGKIIGIILGVVGLVIVVCVVAGVLLVNNAKKDNATNAKVGSCLAGDSITSTTATKVNAVKVVDCTASNAKYKVVGKVDHQSMTDFNGKNVCEAYPTAETVLWTGTDTSDGSILCLAPAK